MTVSLLEIVDNPRQDVPLISVLRSPVFGFTPDRLAEIRSCDREGDFYDALLADGGVDRTISYSVLTQLRDAAADMNVCRLLWHIYDRLALPGIFGAMEGGALRQENLMALTRYAERFEATTTAACLRSFTQLRRLLDAGQAPAVKTAGERRRADDEHSQIQGLEFPIVFLCDLDHAFSSQDFDTPVLVHPALGLGPHCIDLKRKIRYPTMARLALEEKLRGENLAEEQRDLVCGHDPAQGKADFGGCHVPRGKALAKADGLRGLSCTAGGGGGGQLLRDWILLPLLCRPEAAPLRDMAGVMARRLYTGDTEPWQVFIHDAMTSDGAPKKRCFRRKRSGQRNLTRQC